MPPKRLPTRAPNTLLTLWLPTGTEKPLKAMIFKAYPLPLQLLTVEQRTLVCTVPPLGVLHRCDWYELQSTLLRRHCGPRGQQCQCLGTTLYFGKPKPWNLQQGAQRTNFQFHIPLPLGG